MARYAYILFILILTPALQALPQFLEGPYQLSVGPEIYYMVRKKDGGSKQTGLLYGSHFTLERRAPCKFYWAFDGYVARGTLTGHSGSGTRLKSTLTDTQFEGRIGYTFHKKMEHCLSFTPAIGYGYFRSKNAFTAPSPLMVTFHDTFDYALLALITELYVSQEVTIGFNFKAAYMIEGASRTRDDPFADDSKLVIENKMQYEAEFPFKYKCNNFFFEGIPFYRYRHLGGKENYPFNFIDTLYDIWGGRIMFGYEF